MFIYNIKLNGSKWFRIIFVSIVAIVLLVCLYIIYTVYQTSRITDNLPHQDVTELNEKNYASVLQTVHNNIDTYVGQKIRYSGFVYRVYNLNQEQFVLGRHMLISSDFQTVIVGFLCHYTDAVSLADNTWVEIEGTITKGTYHGDMPILEITSLKTIEKPNNEYVYPPSEDFIPTSQIL